MFNHEATSFFQSETHTQHVSSFLGKKGELSDRTGSITTITKPKVPWLADMLEEMKTVVLMHDENKKYSHKVPTTFTATDNRQVLGHFSIRVQLVMLHIIVLFGLILWTMPCRGSIAWTAILDCITPWATFLSANQTWPLSQENHRTWAT